MSRFYGFVANNDQASKISHEILHVSAKVTRWPNLGARGDNMKESIYKVKCTTAVRNAFQIFRIKS